MAKLNKLILCLTLTTSSGLAVADSTADYIPPAPTPVVAPTPTPTPGTTPATPETSTPSINPAAEHAASQESNAATMNMIASAALFAACLAPRHNIWPLCAMGALAAMQGMHDSGASDDSMATFQASTQDGNPNPAFGDGTGNFTDPQITTGLQELKDAGYVVTDTGIRNPDGSFSKAADFSSPAAMAASGMDKSAIDLAQKTLASIDTSGLSGGSNAKVSSVGVTEGGGGASGGAGGDAGANYDSSGGGYNPFKLNAKDKAKLAAGKTVMFDGEPIGVRGQDLFEMVRVVYERKDKNHHFIGSSGGGASLRAPASIVPASVRSAPGKKR